MSHCECASCQAEGVLAANVATVITTMSAANPIYGATSVIVGGLSQVIRIYLDQITDPAQRMNVERYIPDEIFQSDETGH